MKYGVRWKLRYKKLSDHAPIKRCALLFSYIVTDIINVILLKSTKTSSNIDLNNHRNILFIEPQKQGYGDLLFQTPIFEYLGSRCDLDIICQAKHKCILENNPFIKNIISGKGAGNFSRYDCVFYLSRSTVGENLIALKYKNASKVPLDKDLTMWSSAFNDHSHTKAWQKIFDNILNLNGVYSLPRLYIEKSTQDKNSIILIASTENVDKGIQDVDNVIKFFHKTLKHTPYTLKLIGRGSQSINVPRDKNIINYVNKISYRECLDHISSAKLIVGPEGSLTHMSAALGIPTIIGQYGRNYNKYSEIRSDKIFTTDTISVQFLEKSFTKILDGLSD